MQKKPQKLKREKFSYEMLKVDGTSPNRALRKKTFIEYFERFEEFPSYLFDNGEKIDERLSETMQDLLNDPETSKTMHKGIAALLSRMPSDE